jgi:hypothetical protein
VVDITKVRRENIRWQILLTLNNARPIGAYEQIVWSVVRAEYTDSTAQEIRKELDYLYGRDLIEVIKKPDGRWFAEISPTGVDVVEYTVNVAPGIARPEKYFDA